MNENHDEATGQFAPAEPIVGREAREIGAGYVPYKEPEPEASEADIKLRDWAQEKLESYEDRTPEANIKTYGIDLPDNVTLTLEQAAKGLTDARDAEAKQAELDEQARLRAEVDELRGTDKPAEEKQPDIDPKNILEHPKVREAVAIEAANHAKEADEVKQRYSAAIENADQVASSAFRARFPELASQPIEQWQNVLSTMAPDRANEAVGTLQHLMQVKSALQQQQAQQAEGERTRFKAASDRLEEKIKDVPKEQRAEVENEIIAALKERNSDLGNAAKFLRGIQGSSEAMELLWELGDMRAQLKRIKAAPAKAIPKPVPPVQRPGTSGAARETGTSAKIASIHRQMETATGSAAIKLAAQLKGLQRGR